MRFSSVGGKKLKVTLTPREAEKYAALTSDGSENGRGARAALAEILAAAGEAVGFSSAGERLLVQVFAEDSGGCDLFITRLSAIPEGDRRAVTEGGVTTYSERRAHFSFASLAHLLAAARAHGDMLCDLYATDGGVYYLSTGERSLGGVSDADPLLEFGDRVHRLPLGIDGEYGRLVLSGAPLSEVLALFD